MSVVKCPVCGVTIDCDNDLYVVCKECGKIVCKKHVEWGGFVCEECKKKARSK